MLKGSPSEYDLLKMAEKSERNFQEHEMLCSGCDHYRKYLNHDFGKCLIKRGPFNWVYGNNKLCHFKLKQKIEKDA